VQKTTPPRYVHDVETHNRRAPEQVVPWLLEHVSAATVLDVGCGLGTWAAVFADHGCSVLGLEGEDVPDELRQIPRDRFRVADLEGPLPSVGRFDLAICLEVAEHVSAPAGDRLIDFLTSAADTILFSAALPGQGGENHLNEQWPAYWQERFESRGFHIDDAIRWRFWDDDRVDWWYRQNMFLARRGTSGADPVKAVVHPRLLEKKVRAVEAFYRGAVPLRTGLLVFWRSVLHALRGQSGV
jgi:SAM-dependent methyltransferase